MKIYNKYVITLAVSLFLLDSLLALSETDLLIYIVLNVIAFLLVTVFYVHLNPRARRALNTISIVLFACFILIVALKAVEALSGI